MFIHNQNISTMTTVKTLEKRFVDAVRAEDLNAVKELMELADINPDVVRGSLKLLRNNVVLAAYLVGKGADIKIPDLLLPLTSKMWQLCRLCRQKLVLVLCTKTWAPLRGCPTRVAKGWHCVPLLATSVDARYW